MKVLSFLFVVCIMYSCGYSADTLFRGQSRTQTFYPTTYPHFFGHNNLRSEDTINIVLLKSTDGCVRGLCTTYVKICDIVKMSGNDINLANDTFMCTRSWIVPSRIPLDSNKYASGNYPSYAIILYYNDFYTKTSISDTLGKYLNVMDPYLRLTSPAPYQVWEVDSTYQIKWTERGIIDSVDLTFFKNTVNIFNIRIKDQKSFTWTIPSNADSGYYSIKVIPSKQIVPSDSVTFFIHKDPPPIQPPKKTIAVMPFKKSSYKNGELDTLKWTYTGAIKNVKIFFKRPSDIYWYNFPSILNKKIIPNTGYFSFLFFVNNCTEIKSYKVVDAEDSTVFGTSNNVTITFDTCRYLTQMRISSIPETIATAGQEYTYSVRTSINPAMCNKLVSIRIYIKSTYDSSETADATAEYATVGTYTFKPFVNGAIFKWTPKMSTINHKYQFSIMAVDNRNGLLLDSNMVSTYIQEFNLYVKGPVTAVQSNFMSKRINTIGNFQTYDLRGRIITKNGQKMNLGTYLIRNKKVISLKQF